MKVFVPLKVKFEAALAQPLGVIRGVAVGYNKVVTALDGTRWMLKPGCFKRSLGINDRVKLTAMHKAIPFGTVQLTEQNNRLSFDGKINMRTQAGQEAWSNIEEDIYDGLSLEFDPVKFLEKDGYKELTEGRPFRLTLCPSDWAADKEAKIEVAFTEGEAGDMSPLAATDTNSPAQFPDGPGPSVADDAGDPDPGSEDPIHSPENHNPKNQDMEEKMTPEEKKQFEEMGKNLADVKAELALLQAAKKEADDSAVKFMEGMAAKQELLVKLAGVQTETAKALEAEKAARVQFMAESAAREGDLLKRVELMEKKAGRLPDAPGAGEITDEDRKVARNMGVSEESLKKYNPKKV